MKKYLATLCLSLGIAVVASGGHVARAIPLQPVPTETLRSIGLDRQLQSDWLRQHPKAVYIWQTKPDDSTDLYWHEPSRQSLLKAIDRSLYYLSTPKAAKTYRKYAQTEFNLQRVKRSLVRYRELLLTSKSPSALAEAVKQEFVFYQSVGKDKRGRVDFTGYFEPTYQASRVPTAEYRYPIYSQPANLPKRHPTRLQLEGKDGLAGHKSILKGHELVWLRDRLEAFLIQVQGSAKLQLTDGTTMSVGYGGTTNYPYTSIGGELVKDGIFTLEELTLPKLLAYFTANPHQLDRYIPRNNRFIFFRATNGAPPTGSLGVPVTGDRSIATDKSLMPPGALALIVAPIPDVNERGEIEIQMVNRYVLDQDTGSAIKGAGRVDVFLGSGDLAGERAGRLNGSGNLYYLLLKD